LEQERKIKQQPDSSHCLRSANERNISSRLGVYTLAVELTRRIINQLKQQNPFSLKKSSGNRKEGKIPTDFQLQEFSDNEIKEI
jgi:hypothetical protein